MDAIAFAVLAQLRLQLPGHSTAQQKIGHWKNQYDLSSVPQEVFSFQISWHMHPNLSALLASINEMPAPDAVFVFIKISYKIFYNRFRVIRI